MRILALVLCLALGPLAAASSPASAVAAAAADVARQPAHTQPHTRYLSLYAAQPKDREALLKALGFHVNSLSRTAFFTLPRRVADDLYAVNLKDYEWSRETWERLLGSEPYFHQLVVEPAAEVVVPGPEVEKEVVEPWPGGVWPLDGKHYAKGAFPYKRKVKVPGEPVRKSVPGGRKVNGSGAWLDAASVSALVAATQSQVPVVRADWFLFQTAVQADRKAGYYDFLALGKKQADFDDLIGLDPEKSKKAKREIAGILARSGVTLQNRSLVRLQGATGGVWKTQDFKTSVDRQNVLRNLDRDLEPPDGDASEQYGFLPNGLFAFWLQNGKGERQDTAPDFIASDGQSSGTDRRVHVGLSCVRCHVEGIRPVNDYARRLYRGSVQLAAKDYDRHLRLRQLYLEDLERFVRRDQAEYAEALLRLNGTRPAQMAKLYADAWDAYAERDLSPADFARELGVDEKKMLAALKAYAAGGLDPVLAQLIQDPPLPLRREHVEEVYALAQAAIRGYRP